ncbi:hypothetical protein B0J17DRAFT_720398 [Rhizoctonia solani]|nr:hypothetical protein B0J17DRAFT_720398 [Rhizoctonia solani]
MLDNTYPQKDLKKGRLSGGGPTKSANGNKRPADSTPDPNLKKRRKDADLMPAPSVPVNAPGPKADRPTDLSSLPTSALVSYLVKHDVLPPVHPSPYTSQPALAPASLLDSASTETPILTDLDAVHNVLAKLAERHWVTKSVRETDTLAGFMWSAQRARERNLLAASSTGH